MFEENGEVEFEEAVQKSKKAPLTDEQRVINWQLWLDYDACAMSYCKRHFGFDCMSNAEAVHSLAREKFIENNRSDRTAEWYIERQCLDAARSLKLYQPDERKQKYRNVERPTYTPKNANEMQVIKLVKSREISIDEAIRLFDITSECVDYLHFLLDEFYGKKQTTSLNALHESCGDAVFDNVAAGYEYNAFTAPDTYHADLPGFHPLASDRLKQLTTDLLAGADIADLALIASGITPSALNNSSKDKKIIEQFCEMMRHDALAVFDAIDDDVVSDLSYVTPAPVVPVRVVAPVIAPVSANFADHVLANPILSFKSAGIKARDAAEKLGMTVAAYRSKVARAGRKVQEVIDAGQLTLDAMFADIAPVSTPVAVSQAQAKVRKTATYEQMSLFDAPVVAVVPEPVVEVDPAVAVALVQDRATVFNMLRNIVRTASNRFFGSDIQGVSGSVARDNMFDGGGGYQRAREAVGDRGSGAWV